MCVLRFRGRLPPRAEGIPGGVLLREGIQRERGGAQVPAGVRGGAQGIVDFYAKSLHVL